MGKEWYWVGKSSKKSVIVEQGAKTTTPSGCMCAVFQLFDFHTFQFPTTLNNQQQENSFKSLSCISQDQINKGIEAPRNSLESEDGTFSSLSKEDNFKMPKNIQIKTKRSNVGNLNDFSSEMNSPGTKTPTLVARLMGLEILPNENSPTFSSCLSTPNSQGKNIIQNFHQVRTKQHIQTKHRNSIDSSEISSTRKSDVDYYHHRLSLQINKENLCEDLELPRFSFSKKKIHDENNSSNKSSSHYARQIVKQVKESVTRKVGQDITNNNLKNKEFVEQSRIKKSSKTSLKPLDEFSSEGKHSNSSFSPRIRFIDNKHKPNTTTSKELNTPPNFVKAPPPQPKLPRVLTKQKGQESRDKKSVSTKCKKSTNEKFSSRFSSRFHSPKSSSRANDIKSNTKSKKSTQPLSSNLLNNINAVVKTDTFVQKQVSDPQNSKFYSHLSNCSSKRYKNEVTTTLLIQETITNFTKDKFNGSSIIETHKPEFQYITEILNKQGTTKTVSFNKWFSPTHPLDPSIFHHLEHNPKDKVRNFITKNQLGHRWNRKLLFDLVDEVLIEILKPNGSKKKLSFLHSFCNEWTIMELTERVWKRIGEFPCAKCEVLDDIDNLIEAEDMEKLIKVEGEEEGEGLVEEIEGNILDMLMHETVMVIGRN